MRLSELSAQSGVPTATIKFYLREALLPPGRRLSATQAEYGEEHLRRLRLVRALIQVGHMPVTTVREVLAAVDDDSLSQHARLGSAVWSLPRPAQNADPEATPEETAAARREVDALLDSLDWHRPDPDTSPLLTLIDAVVALSRLGYPCGAEQLLPYARIAARTAEADLDLLEHFEGTAEQVEASVVLTVLYEPVLLSLRRLAQAEESVRRFGGD